MKTHSIRLLPNTDLKNQIVNLCAEKNISSGIILSSVGSLKSAHLRLSDKKTGSVFQGPFEILSLNGTLAKNGIHLHICISDSSGQTIGGHLLEGCLIHTTCELVIGEISDLEFIRELDPQTNYMELKIK